MLKLKAGVHLCFSLILFLWLSGSGTAAEVPVATGEVKSDSLRLEEAIRIALKYHPKIKGAEEEVGAQRAVVGQSLSAYYPEISFNNFYRTSLSGTSTSTSQTAFDFLSSRTDVDMTLYDFGKREGTVQSARDSLDATRYALKTSVDDVVLAVKEAYYRYLAAEALVKVGEDTVKDRELLVRQAKGFYEVGTRAKIELARAESNLFNAQANLITARNGVKIAWATLKNTMGVKDLSKRPVAEGLSFKRLPIRLAEAKEAAFASRPELKDLDAQRKSEDQKIATARRGHLPDLLQP